MKIDKTNNLQSSQKRQMVYTAAGIGAGAVAGGAFGYIQKPWIKNGEITDTFIKRVGVNDTEHSIKTINLYIAELKKVSETGNLDNISEYTKANFIETQNKPAEQIKIQAQKYLEELKQQFETKDLDELQQKAKKTIQEKLSFDGTQKRLDELKTLKISDNISVEEIARLYKEKVPCLGNKSAQKIQQEITYNGKEFVLEELKEAIDDKIKNYQEDITGYKNSIKQHIDISGKMKNISCDADIDEKDFYNIIKKTIKDMNWKNAGKWAGIGAVALGVIGLGTAVLSGKKQTN